MPSKIGNFFMKVIVSSPFHSVIGDSYAVITVTGRKTGRQYSTPINVIEEGDVYTATSLRNRGWWRNLRHGRAGKLRVSGRQYTVCCTVIEKQDEVAVGLKRLLEHNPRYARFFGVGLTEDGLLQGDELVRAAGKRVIIYLYPSDAP